MFYKIAVIFLLSAVNSVFAKNLDCSIALKLTRPTIISSLFQLSNEPYDLAVKEILKKGYILADKESSQFSLDVYFNGNSVPRRPIRPIPACFNFHRYKGKLTITNNERGTSASWKKNASWILRFSCFRGGQAGNHELLVKNTFLKTLKKLPKCSKLQKML